MGAQGKRFRVFRVELGDQFTPQQSPGPQLGDLHEEVHPDAPEERQSRRELVDGKVGGQAGLDVLDAVGQRVGQLQIRCRSGLLDVIAGDGDRVELRHPRAGVAEDVRDDPHRRLRRVDVGVADHELFEDVVLDGPGQLLRRHALFLGGHHVEREDRQHRAVHRHRDRDGGQVDTVEQLPHIENGIDCHACHSDVTGDARVVGVVAAVGGEVECHRQALLSGRQVAPVERVGLRGGGEAGVLPDGPRLIDVHRRIRPAQVGRRTREGVERVARRHRGVPVGGDVDRLDVDGLRRRPVELFWRVAVRFCGGDDVRGDRRVGSGFGRPLATQGNLGEAADSCCGGHRHAPNRVSSSDSVSTASILAVR